MQRSTIRWLSLFALMIALVPGLTQPPQAAAQYGTNAVVFWDDQPTPSSPTIPETPDSGFHYLNPTGGRTQDDGLFTIVGNGRYHIIRDRDWQTYSDDYAEGTVMWMVAFSKGGDDFCISQQEGDHRCRGSGDNLRLAWDTITLSQTSDLSAKMTMVGAVDDITITLVSTSTYDPNYPYYVTLDARLSIAGSGAGGVSNLKLYLGADLNLDGDFNSAGILTDWKGKQLVAGINDTSVGGIRASGRAFSSYTADTFYCSIYYWFFMDCNMTAGAGGPAFNEPLTNIINDDPTTDIGVGAQWDITSLPASISTQLFFVSREDFENPPPDPIIPDDSDTTGDGARPAVCNEPATLTLKPDPLEIAPGGAATVWVEMSNPCRDRPTADADALLSFSDGLTVIETSAGVLNLGQRAALQRFALAPGETRGWYAIVRASDPFISAPLAIGEIYAGAAVVRTDDLVFTVPTTPAAPVVETAPAAPVVETAPAAPAPLPIALPNTAGEQTGSALLLFALGLAAAGGAALLLRRR